MLFAEVNAALMELDAMLDRLMSELEQRELLGCVNIIFVSDHGFLIEIFAKVLEIF